MCRGFAGNVTFTYNISDGAGTANATVTLVIPQPAPLQSSTANYTASYNTNFTGPSSVLDDIQAANPGAGPLTVVGVTTQPPPSVGTVVVDANGSFVFVPAANWTGECGRGGRWGGGGATPRP